MKIEDIKKVLPLDKEKFYLFRIGKKEWTPNDMIRFQNLCKREGIQGIVIEADNFEVVEIDSETYKLVKKEADLKEVIIDKSKMETIEMGAKLMRKKK